MGIPTFNPPIAPSPGTRHAPKVNILEAAFGDGYTQASPNGLNHIRQNLTLKWDGITEAQYLEILSFFEARGGYEPFSYQPRGFTKAHLWTAREWSGADDTPWRFEVKLQQWFGVVPGEIAAPEVLTVGTTGGPGEIIFDPIAPFYL